MRSKVWALLVLVLGCLGASLALLPRNFWIWLVLIVTLVTQLFCLLMMVLRSSAEDRSEDVVRMLREDELRRRIDKLLLPR